MTDTVNVPRELIQRLIDYAGEDAGCLISVAHMDALSDALDVLAAAPKAEPDELKDPDAVEHYDDGSKVVLDGYTGGGHVLGAWGKLTLRFIAANGTETVREYTADDIRQAEASKAEPVPMILKAPCQHCQRMTIVPQETLDLLQPEAPKAGPVSDLPPISLDGPNLPNDHRVWLARQLLDSKSDDATACGIVAFHPAISDLWKKSKTFKSIKPEAPKVAKGPVLTGIVLEGSQGDPAGMMTVKAELSDGRQVTLIQSSGNNIYHWASTYNLPFIHPAPASDELLEALEGIVHFSDGFEAYGKQTTLGRALAQWINEARSLLAKHKEPQS